ncbi:hypothetical protein TNCV_585111 [Trichonephila clavipes]|nr:hypothetical protein TNCV_585111 [Trichonephila clavipes]
MATPPIFTSTILPWDWRGGKYSPVPCTRDSAHKTFGPTDLTSTPCVIGGYLVASGIKPRPCGLESDALTTRLPTARNLIPRASFSKDKKACLSAVGVRAMISISSAKTNNLDDLLKIFPLVLILESLTAFSNARLKRRHASASPCRTPFFIPNGFEKSSCI